MLIVSEASSGLANFSGISPGTILAVSDNSEELLNMRPAELMDTNVFEVSTSPFTPASISSLKLALEAADLAAHAPLILALSRREDGKMYAIAHATEEGIVLDLEPFAAGFDRVLEGALRAQSLVKSGLTNLQD